MDNNNDGIIDDPLATRKRGRKSLGLTKDEWKHRKNEQRKQRLYDAAVDERRQTIAMLGVNIIEAYTKHIRECNIRWFDEDETSQEYVFTKMCELYDAMAEDESLFLKPLPKFRS